MGKSKMIPVEIKNHQEYIDILNKLKEKTKYIILVQINGYDEEDEIVAYANSVMELEQKGEVRKWLGTITRGGKAVQYTYVASKAFFKYLYGFSSFFFNTTSRGCGFQVIDTEFGLDDIAFLDQDRNVLFYTTTHEGYANIEKGLLE